MNRQNRSKLGRVSGRAVSETICDRGCGFNVGGPRFRERITDRDDRKRICARSFFVRAISFSRRADLLADASVRELKRPVIHSPTVECGVNTLPPRVNCFIGEIPRDLSSFFHAQLQKTGRRYHFMVSGNGAHSSNA